MKFVRSLMLVAVICLLSVVAIPNMSRASMTTGIGEWGMGSFNNFVFTSTDPVFDSPGIDQFWDTITYASVSDWSAVFESGYKVTSLGSTRDQLGWQQLFNDSFSSTAFSFEIYGYLGSTLMDWTTASYDGLGNFHYVVHELNPGSVPEPATMLLLGLGLLGIVPLRKKMK